MVTKAQKAAAAKARRARNRFKGVKLLNLAETAWQGDIWTKAAFNTGIWTFFTAGTPLNPNTQWTGVSAARVTFRELLQWPSTATGGVTAGQSRLQIIQSNLSMDTIIGAVVQSALVGVGFKVAKKVLRKPLRQGNALLRFGNVADIVKL